ncbi:TfoX/Sxy family protein [Rhizobium alvei]|uniref:TfoX/Sxy family protein n=1 Tax=Rhizobium alvei TaxID=1132659 RepID=A0ABT8YHL4_9HYPH|nr:TfoX/Sxy family protein [Rhizobium alvei]MDO6963165.1 TfoX/Sxy family protein [Rhizobium alvei]
MDNETIEELFQSVGKVAIRRMFGGKGIYCDGVIIALVVSGDLMLKGDAQSGPLYEEAGGRRWTYRRANSDKTASMPYWTIPEAAFDDPDEAARWARIAYETGLRAN